MAFALDDVLPEEFQLHEAARKLVTTATRRLFDGELGPLGSDAGNNALHGFFDWREAHPSATLGDLLRSILSDFDAEPGPGTLADAIQELRAKEDDEDFDLHGSVYLLDETVIASALAQILFEGGVDDDARDALSFALARQSHAYVLSRVFGEVRSFRRAALREAERLVTKAGRPTRAATRAERRKPPAPPWREGDVVAHRLPQGKIIFLHLFSTFQDTPSLYVLDWDAPELPSTDGELAALLPKPSNDQSKLILVVPSPLPQESEEAWRKRLHEVLIPTGRAFSGPHARYGPLVRWDELDDHLLRHWRWPDVEPPPEHVWPLPPLPRTDPSRRAGPLYRIASTTLRVPEARTTLAPPTEPEGKLKQVLEGGQREGGINVSPAGPVAKELIRAYCWHLREAGFQVPGATVTFAPTTRLASGAFEIAMEHAAIVLMGVEPERMRAICRGQATAEGIDWIAGALIAVAHHCALDPAPIEAARLLLHERGLYGEWLLLQAQQGDVDLRAYLALRPKAVTEIILEHRTAGATLRGVVPVPEPDTSWAGTLKLVKGAVQLAPAHKYLGPAINIAVKQMSPVASTQ